MHDGTFGSFNASRRERVDIHVGVERRRRLSRAEKLRIVRALLEPNAVVTDVARRNEVSASLIYMWRRQALAGLMEGFHRVEVVSETRADRASATDDHGTADAAPPTIETATPATTDPPSTRLTIEVTLPGGTIVRVEGAVDGKSLRTVLGALVEK